MSIERPKQPDSHWKLPAAALASRKARRLVGHLSFGLALLLVCLASSAGARKGTIPWGWSLRYWADRSVGPARRD